MALTYAELEKTFSLPYQVDLYFDGGERAPANAKYARREDPSNKNLQVAKVAQANEDDVRAAIDAAREAFDQNRAQWVTDHKLREKVLMKVGEMIRENVEALATMETLTSGKNIRTSRLGDVPRSAELFEYYAGLATKVFGNSFYLRNGDHVSIVKEPVGVVGAIVPWNFPLVIAARQVAPALAAGCTVIVKPASYTPVTARMLMPFFEKAGLPKGVLNFVTGPGASVGAEIVKSQKVDAVTFTGETATGKWIMEAGAANLKRLALELGGKNPDIVFEEADLEAASTGAVFGAFANNGETCAAGSRVVVQESIYEKFARMVVQKVANLRVGSAIDENTDIGPLVSEDQMQKVLSYVRIGREEGAKLMVGGGPLIDDDHKDGYFVQPAVFSDVTPDMRIAQEEIFGPVVTITPFKSEAEAIEIANGTVYGLAAGVWGSQARVQRVARSLKAGTVWVNTYYTIPAENPWGGYKQSGIGRENGIYGLEAFLEIKTIYQDTGGATYKPYFKIALPPP
jgi:betaine-aldehyde dehydrogenase